MRPTQWLRIALFGVCVSPAFAAVYVDNATLVSKSPQYAAVAPSPHLFTITAAGRYRLDVRDAGFPAPLTGVDAIVAKGTQSVVRLTQFGTMEFDAAAGDYTIYVTGAGTTAGTAGVFVESVASGAHLIDYQAAIQPSPIAPSSAVSSFEAELTPTVTGNYQLTLTDRSFPTALLSYDAAVFAKSGGAPLARICSPACGAWPSSFSAGAGTSYDLFIRAEGAASTKAGLFSLKIATGVAGAAPLYAATHPVGTLEPHATFNFPADDLYGFTLRDLTFPVALVSGRALIAQGGEVLISAGALADTPQSFSAKQGTAAIYAIASPQSSQNVGTFGVQVNLGAQAIYSNARAVVASSATNIRAYAFTAPISTAGRYRIQARDFGFPASIPALQFLTTQDGAPLGAFTVGGSLSVPARGGTVLVIAIANALSPTATGLFGLSVESESSGNRVLDVTQGVGDVFHTQTAVLNKTGNVDVSLNDLQFPQGFEELAAIVTRGDNLLGYILGGGTFRFAGTPGDYTVNFLARNKTGANYGLYGLKVEDSAVAAPTVSISAQPANVALGAQTLLTWSSTGATTCDAAGGWSGGRALSGSATSASITADSTFSLTCTGTGGSATMDVRVTVVGGNSAAGSSGGGAFDSMWLALLSAVALAAFLVQRDNRKFR